jgi:protocatechuate 3,4-dioxygenase beta subunit
MILLIAITLTAIFVAGCTTPTTTSTPQAGTTPTSQATPTTASDNEKTWPVSETHESGPGSIHGTVTLVSGGPAAGYAVYIWADGADEDKDPAFAMVRTDASGKFEIKDIPNGYYTPRIPHRAGDGGYGEYSQIHVEGDTTWDDTTQK